MIKFILLFVILSFLVFGTAENAAEAVELLTNDEEVIMSAIVANATSDGSREEVALQAHLFQEALRSTNRADVTDDFSIQNGEVDQSSQGVASVAVTKSEDEMTAWELVKAQIAADFAPFLLLIPAPVKVAAARWIKQAKESVANVAFGALQPTLLVSSKFFHNVGDKLSNLAKYLESNRAQQFVSLPRSSPVAKATNKLSPKDGSKRGKHSEQKHRTVSNTEKTEIYPDSESEIVDVIESDDVEVIEL